MKTKTIIMKLKYIFFFFFITFISQAQCWKEISIGASHTLAIHNDGTLWAWGKNSQGQLGDGTTINKTTPIQIGTFSNWKMAYCGTFHSIALKTDGTLWVWGLNSQGQLGDGTNINKLIPTQIGTNDWKLISAGSAFSVAIKNNGDIYTCGQNNYGQLGDGTLINKNTFNLIYSGTNWKLISSGANRTIVIKNDDTLWGWGSNSSGSLGNGTIINILTPTLINANNNWKTVSCGGGHTLALKNDNSLWCWGQNDHRQIGNGNNINQLIPIQIGTSTNWKMISGGGIYSLALKNDNTLWGWGTNTYGQLGNGLSGGDIHVPTQANINTDWVKIFASPLGSSSMAIKNNASLFAWGYNSDGQLGDGTIIQRNSPVQVSNSCSATLDLIVKDGSDDTGAEPNTSTSYMWTSDHIWIRNYNDNGLEHQNPDYSSTGNANFVKVKVINNSFATSLGNEQLKLYWAKASTALSYPNPWMGGITYNPTGASMGSPIGTLNIPVLQPGEETILTFPWIVPNPNDYGTDGDQWHFCLLARITATNDPMTSTETTDLNANVRNNNNIAWKNVTVVDILPNNTVNPGGIISVGNPFNHPKTFFLEMEISDLETGKPIYEEAEIGIKMDDVLYNAWVRGGKEAQLLDSTIEEKRKIVTGNKVILDNLSFNANEIGTLRLDFNFLTKELTDKTNYAYHVIQKDSENGNIIGGETFIINKTPRESFEANTNNDLEVDLNQSITISADDINEPAIYNWYDNEGNLIYQGKDLEVANAVSEKYKLEVISTVDGFKDYVEVEVKIKPSTLETISPNPAQNNVKIGYKLNTNDSAYLMILGYYGSNGISNNYILDVNSNEIDINVSNYPSGFYTVALIINGNIIDAKTLIKQ